MSFRADFSINLKCQKTHGLNEIETQKEPQGKSAPSNTTYATVHMNIFWSIYKLNTNGAETIQIRPKLKLGQILETHTFLEPQLIIKSA